jgi:hypothetical protein
MTEHDSELKTELAQAFAVDAFLEAVGTGDEIEVAKALRQIASLTDALQRMALEVLADRFEGVQDPYYPWALKFHRPKQSGAPPKNPLRTALLEFATVSLVKKLKANSKLKLAAAFYDVSKQPEHPRRDISRRSDLDYRSAGSRP